KKEKEMKPQERVAHLKKLLGDDIADEFIGKAAKLQERAEKIGLASKEAMANDDDEDTEPKGKKGKQDDTAENETDKEALALAMKETIDPLTKLIETTMNTLDAQNKAYGERFAKMEKQIRILAGIGTKGTRESEDAGNTLSPNKEGLSEKEQQAVRLQAQW